MLGGGGVDGAIHKAAGKRLVLECATLGGCKPGQAKATKGYNLPCEYVIHTVGPKWKDGNQDEEVILQSCYRESLNLAKKMKCKSVAFPLIASGVYGYPRDQALKVAIDTISGFLHENEMLVYVVVYDKKSFQISEKLFVDITSFIDDKYVDAKFEFRRRKHINVQESLPLGNYESSTWEDKTVLAETTVLAPKAAQPSVSTIFYCLSFVIIYFICSCFC